MLGIVELLNRQIRAHSNRIGQVVRNLHGAVAGVTGEIQDAAAQSWLVVSHPGRELLPIEEFFQLISTSADRVSVQVVEGVLGSASHARSDTALVLVRGVVSATAVEVASVRVDSVGDFAIYVNGKLERRGQGTATIEVAIPAGGALLEVLAASPSVTVTLPTATEVSGALDIVPQPVWDSINPLYMDPQLGVASIRLQWYSDPRVGGWRIQRREVEDLGLVVSATALGVDQATFTVADDHTALSLGSEVFVRGQSVGTLASSFYDSVELETSLRVRLRAAAPAVDTWAGSWASTGEFEERATVRRITSAGTARWDDTSVETGKAYEYRLQAFGTIDSQALSKVSDTLSARAGDTEAPAGITIAAGYPISLNRRVTVRFRTPADTDYAGVKVYYRPRITTTVATVTGLDFTLTGLTGMTVNEYQGWQLYREIDAEDAALVTIASNTGTTFTLPEALFTALAPGQTVELFQVLPVLTDYGVPDTDDELSFAAQEDGEYLFASFDRSGNEQLQSEAVVWDYVAADDDAYSVPPLVSIRQLTPTEQQEFAAPYDDATRWTVVLIDAKNLQGGSTGVTLYYQLKGEGVRSMAALTAPLLSGQPHNPSPITDVGGPPVAGADCVVDIPAGVRSRFVAIERTAEASFIRVWAAGSSGLESGRSQFTVDYNETPQVTSLECTYDEGRANASGTEGVVEVRVVVDDDTRSFKMWVEPAGTGEPSSGAPFIVADTALEGAVGVLGNVALGPATRKTVKVQPYSAPALAGTAGDVVQRDLTRSPRSQLILDNRDQQGRTSAEVVRAGFSMTPAPTQVWPPTGDSTLTSVADDSVTVTGAGWTTDQFAGVAQVNKLYVVEVKMTRGAETHYAYREIISNTATQLVVDADWPATGDLRPIAGDKIRIVNGSIVARVGAPNSTGIAWGVWENLLPPRVLYFERAGATEQYVEFYAALNGVPLETPNRVMIDSNNVPSIEAITLTQVGNNLRVTLINPDDDVKLWHVYAKKGPTRAAPGDAYHWPTVSETTLGQLEPKYLRAEMSISDNSFDMAAGEGCWYVLVVPYNSFNDRGTADSWPSEFMNVASSPVTVPRLLNLRAEDFDDEPNDDFVNLIKWDTENIAEVSTTHTAQVEVYAPALGFGAAGVYQLITPLAPSGVKATGDYVSYGQSLTTHLANTINDEGSWPMVLTGSPFRRGTGAPGDLAVTVNYRVKLYDAGDLIESYSWSRLEYWEAPVPSVSSAGFFIAGGTATSEGSPPQCNAPESHEVTWVALNPSPATHYVRIHRATDTSNPPTSYSMVRDGVAGDDTTAAFTLNGYYTPASGGTLYYVRYKVELRLIADNSLVSESITRVVSVRRSTCTSYDT